MTVCTAFITCISVDGRYYTYYMSPTTSPITTRFNSTELSPSLTQGNLHSSETSIKAAATKTTRVVHTVEQQHRPSSASRTELTRSSQGRPPNDLEWRSASAPQPVMKPSSFPFPSLFLSPPHASYPTPSVTTRQLITESLSPNGFAEVPFAGTEKATLTIRQVRVAVIECSPFLHPSCNVCNKVYLSNLSAHSYLIAPSSSLEGISPTSVALTSK